MASVTIRAKQVIWWPIQPCPPKDSSFFDAPGKLGIADIELSDDEQSLWVISLDDNTLNEIAIGLPAVTPTAGSVTKHPIVDPGCANGDYRPWGMKLYQGNVYVGVVCTAETSQNTSDLHAYVLAHDPAGANANFTTIFDFSLDYSRSYRPSIHRLIPKPTQSGDRGSTNGPTSKIPAWPGSLWADGLSSAYPQRYRI